MNSLVTSRLDYCNSLLVGVADGLLQRLQCAQDWAARTVLQLPRPVEALPHSVSRTLRSIGANLLHVPKSNIVKGDRAFMIAGQKCGIVYHQISTQLQTLQILRRNSRLSFIGRLLSKAPVNLLETERYINFNINIIIYYYYYYYFSVIILASDVGIVSAVILLVTFQFFVSVL